MTDRWTPLQTQSTLGRPDAGDVIAYEHAAWEITAVNDAAPTDSERDKWVEEGMPDPWHNRPYIAHLRHLGGVLPNWATADAVPTAQVRVGPGRSRWARYRGSRWPMCSCCGEPMPCRAEVEDREVTKSLREVEKFARIPAGACWACAEPISRRQRSVAYDGDNLDLPGAQSPRFHIRGKCGHWAESYERRWIAVDPRRERLLTYPQCGGILVTHGDGSTECVSGPGIIGQDMVGEPDCRGHLTHDHGAHRACYVGDAYFAPASEFPGCPRGCARDGHPGAARGRRPRVRQPDQGSLIGGEPS